MGSCFDVYFMRSLNTTPITMFTSPCALWVEDFSGMHFLCCNVYRWFVDLWYTLNYCKRTLSSKPRRYSERVPCSLMFISYNPSRQRSYSAHFAMCIMTLQCSNAGWRGPPPSFKNAHHPHFGTHPASVHQPILSTIWMWVCQSTKCINNVVLIYCLRVIITHRAGHNTQATSYTIIRQSTYSCGSSLTNNEYFAPIVVWLTLAMLWSFIFLDSEYM